MTRSILKLQWKPWACLGWACVFFGVGCESQNNAPIGAAEPPSLATVTITTAPVEPRLIPRELRVVGTLSGLDEVMVAPKVDGRVNRMYVDIGDRIYPGETILELDPIDLQLEVDAARRGLEAELARLGLTKLPQGEFSVEDVPAVIRAQVAIETAEKELTRARNLGRAAISSRELDACEQDYKLAEAAKRDIVTQTLAILATARLRQAQLEAAEQRLQDAVVKAPPVPLALAWGAVAGSHYNPVQYAVASRLISEGTMIRSNPVTNACRLVIDFLVKLRANVPEQFSPEVRVGQALVVRVDAYPTVDFPGRITRINPTVDPLTRTFSVEITIPNLQNQLKVGGFARAYLVTRYDEDRLTVPPQAIVSFAGVSKVFVIEDNVARAVEVMVGQRDAAWVEIVGQLPPNAIVATSGFSQLIDGSPVKLRK